LAIKAGSIHIEQRQEFGQLAIVDIKAAVNRISGKVHAAAKTILGWALLKVKAWDIKFTANKINGSLYVLDLLTINRKRYS
jgi:hypothetical protein